MRLLSLFLLFVLFAPLHTHAAQPLVFGDVIPLGDAHLLTQKTNINVDTAVFSHVDLNADGYDELITKPKQCDKSCAYTVLGRTPHNNFVVLAQINARDLIISDAKHMGIRNILAQNKPDNDFASSLYIWDTLASRYILKE